MRYENPYRTWQATLFLALMWLGMVVVIIHNARTAWSTPAAEATFTPREVLVFVSQDSTVYTMDSGLQTAHVPLVQCPARQLHVLADDGAPAFTLTDVTWLDDELLAFRFWADRPYYIVSSNLGASIHAVQAPENPALHIVLECPPRAQQQHLLAFVWLDDMLYMHNVGAGSLQPIMSAPQACRVAWQTQQEARSVATWDMAVPLETGAGILPPDSLVAFSLTVTGELTVEVPAFDGLILHYEDTSLRLWSDCR